MREGIPLSDTAPVVIRVVVSAERRSATYVISADMPEVILRLPAGCDWPLRCRGGEPKVRHFDSKLNWHPIVKAMLRTMALKPRAPFTSLQKNYVTLYTKSLDCTQRLNHTVHYLVIRKFLNISMSLEGTRREGYQAGHAHSKASLC